MFERWKKAVVHLECATDSEHFSSYYEKLKELDIMVERGDISPERYREELSRGKRDVRFHGTALFISHENRRYLLTARHVLWDEHGANLNIEDAKKKTEILLQFMQERAGNQIFKIMFRVPSIDEVLSGQQVETHLMNLNAGTTDSSSYTFSDPSLDLAIISLDKRHSNFADELISRGFVPIPSTDIAEGPDEEGQDITAIGFPSSTALLGQVNDHPTLAQWASSLYSLPVSSFGRVSMLHNALPFFWADISIYPGNSGGPVIANDRLVGIVSSQATLAIDAVPEIRTRIPFGRIIKTSFVFEMLKIQIQKDCGTYVDS